MKNGNKAEKRIKRCRYCDKEITSDKYYAEATLDTSNGQHYVCEPCGNKLKKTNRYIVPVDDSKLSEDQE